MTQRTGKPTRDALGLRPGEFATLVRLDSPWKIQQFLYRLEPNWEPDGDRCRTVRSVLAARDAHCIEGAMLAACALWIHGDPPLLLDLRSEQDYDHVVAVFRRRGRWGAISKTNGVNLRWRDPVYRSLRELAMSWFHEYNNRRDEKTLREYSVPFDLRRVPCPVWVSGEDDAWSVAEKLDEIRHYRLVSKSEARALVRLDPFEHEVSNLVQHPRPRWLRERIARRRAARRRQAERRRPA